MFEVFYSTFIDNFTAHPKEYPNKRGIPQNLTTDHCSLSTNPKGIPKNLTTNHCKMQTKITKTDTLPKPPNSRLMLFPVF